MRTLQLSLVGMLTLALLGGLSAMVVAQDDPMAPALVTGSVIKRSSGPTIGTVTTNEYGATLRTGFVGFAEWEASDPRLSGTDTYTGNWQRYAAGFQVEASTRVVENDDGRWVGTATGLDDSRITTDAVIMHGEDAFEGLTAYVVIDYTASPIEFVAAIFPGEMPPFPEPAE